MATTDTTTTTPPAVPGLEQAPAVTKPSDELKTTKPLRPGRRKKAAATPAAKPGKRVTGRDAIAQVLADGKPAKAKDITAAAVKLVRPAMTGKTPEATLGALLYTQAKKPDGLVVRTKNRAEFKLRPVKPEAK